MTIIDPNTGRPIDVPASERRAALSSSAASPLATYGAAILAIALVVVQALVATAHFTPTAVIQLAIVAVAAIATYLVPLVPGKWAGAAKTGVAVLGAVLSSLVPLITGGDYSPQTIGLVVLAALQALGTEIGVNLRKDSLALAA